MIIGQVMVYHFNGLHNAKVGDKRNVFRLVNVESTAAFKPTIESALDSLRPGMGYVLAKWNKKLFKCEKDLNNPEADYVRHQLTYHPLQNHFTV